MYMPENNYREVKINLDENNNRVEIYNLINGSNHLYSQCINNHDSIRLVAATSGKLTIIRSGDKPLEFRSKKIAHNIISKYKGK